MNNNAILALDIGTTKVIAIVAQNDLKNRINILGVGNCKSEGIDKGSIIDLEQSSAAITDAISTARQSSSVNIESTYVSISGAHTRSIRGAGAVNVQSGHISTNEINQVLQMALYNAKIIPEYEVLHVLPLYFKIDDANEISNPLNMNGSRLEVYANIITVKKSAIANIQNTLKSSQIDIINFVLNGYASSLAVLEDDQKRLGTAVLELGGSTSELTIFKGNTVAYNDFVAIGSENITSDLSIILHTPYNAANMIKNQYSSLLPIKVDGSTISKVKIPLLGNETETKEIPLVQIQPIIHARIEELLLILKEKIKLSGMSDKIDGGIVITGGIAQIDGIGQLAQKIFEHMPVRISNPINIQNGYIDFNTPILSTIAGLVRYGLDADPFFELDSKKELRGKKEDEKIKVSKEANINIQIEEPISKIKIDDKKSKKSFWEKVGKWL